VAPDPAKKLFVGPRFRRIRQQLGLSQTQIAEGLGISPSYVNLIERNQRPVTAQILLRLAEAYDLDLRDLATADEDRFFAELNEIFSDPLFRQIDLPKQELRDLAELCPGVTHALQRLYAAYTEARRGETLVAAQMADRDEGTRFEANPIERVRDLIEANRNYFPELETAAENLRDELNVANEDLYGALSARLREKHSVVTRLMPVDVMRETLRRFDRHRRQLLISELIDIQGRVFQLAFQIGLAEAQSHFETIVARAGPLDDAPRRLYRISLANYFAAAVMMPYPAFHSAAESLSYDVHVLAQRFNSGFEQVCHRLTTLQRPNARGIPFFLLRVDNAGNVSKRFSSGTFPFSNFGGTCPLWNVHSTFDTPDLAVETGDRTARRHALFLDRANGAATDRPAPSGPAALCHRTRLRNPPRNKTGLCRWHGSGKDRGHADRRQLPALRAGELQPARRAAHHPHSHSRRKHPSGVVIRLLQCA
jgi:predicted transcriptional regulator/DNA-binding XRE family transcriptional regulator